MLMQGLITSSSILRDRLRLARRRVSAFLNSFVSVWNCMYAQVNGNKFGKAKHGVK